MNYYINKKFLIPILSQIVLCIFFGLIIIPDKAISQLNIPFIQNEICISQLDSALLSDLPTLKTPLFLKNKTLPSSLDNSIQPYMRPFFEQVSLECGQYSGIALNFNYEINYRRSLASNVPENQYPTHFTYNFMHGGNGWSGVSYIHSFEIVKTNGQPNVVDYGGDSYGGVYRWLSGYDNYYNGMWNRIDEVYQINVGTPDGLLTLKNWLENHLEGADVGGIASFYSGNPWNTTTLPAGTPEAGKHVIVEFGTPGHASTIVGWNDSIRFDYNYDGSYTNDIDINDDGIVDMKDWEIGGLLFTESYNGGLAWADSGYCYMMYKTLADKVYEGGIWNHAVHVLKVKENYHPLLTYKIKIKHNSRNKIKVSVGVSDTNSPIPEYTLSFPIFNFQGGSQYMQGGTSLQANKTIEFGLDVTPLLGMINSGEEAIFYLIVEEDDPNSAGSGQIISFSLMDYTNGLQETECPLSNIPIQNNSLSFISLTAAIDFDQLIITTSALPHAVVDVPYSQQLNYAGGVEPYDWSIVKHYEQSINSADFPQIDDVQLVPSNNENGIAIQKIDFEFPFYDQKYDSLYVHVDGFVMFDEQVFPWPYMYDPSLMLRKTRIIAPFLNKYAWIDPDSNDGIWYEGNENFAAFKWIVTIDGQTPVENVIFAVILFPNGNIEYFYGSDNMFTGHIWTIGISDGDDINYYNLDQNTISTGTRLSMEPSLFPIEMTLSEDGLFHGTPTEKYTDVPIEFLVEDYNNVRVRKTMPFYSWYTDINNAEKTIENINCFPNPFTEKINIEFDLVKSEEVTLIIMNAIGRELKSFFLGNLPAGKQSITWEATNESGEASSKGVCFVQLIIGGQKYSKKIVLL